MIRQANPNGLQLITPITSTPDRKPVSESAEASYVHDATPQNNDGIPSMAGTPLASTPDRKPVSESLPELWVKTLAALQTWLPAIQISFLARLIAVVAGLFSGLGDGELAEAVEFAFVHRKGELSGDILLTAIPDAIRALRSGRRRPPRDNPGETPSADPPVVKLFEQLMGAFLSLGVAVSPGDLKRCRGIWSSLDSADKDAALRDVLAKHAGWSGRAEQYVPRPWNYLANGQWKRKAVAHGRNQDESKGEASMRRASEQFRQKYPGGLK